ncbi:MAG: hypothetical protein EBZ36_14820, partial [Acidobacteria bacterium]|nr:hypothetical protein [Acidobacteriota bacterium]
MLILLCVRGYGSQALAQSSSAPIAGRWEATVTVNDAVIPFRLDLTGKEGALTATLFNGEVRQTSTDAAFDKGVLRVSFDHYLTKIVANLKEGRLEGRVRLRNDKDGAGNTFSAARYRSEVADTANVPSIEGLWIVPRETNKGEKSWRLIVSQKGAELSAAILRIDGDTGSLTGRWRNDKFVLGANTVTATVNGGDGTADILSMDATSAATASGSSKFAGLVTGFENLTVTSATNQKIDLAVLGNYRNVSTSSGNGLELSNFASGGTLTLTGAGTAYTLSNNAFASA